MDPWYKLVTPRKEVSAGRSFNPDEFAIALELVVAGTAPDDKEPERFFSRNQDRTFHDSPTLYQRSTLDIDEVRLLDFMLLAVPRK